MTDCDKVEEIVKEISDNSNILDNYFIETGGNNVHGTQLLEDRFFHLFVNSLNIDIERPKISKTIRCSLRYGTLWGVFSKLQNEIKGILLPRFSHVIMNVMTEAKLTRETEVNQLRTEKEEQIRILEERLSTLQEKADNFEEQIKSLEADNKTMKNCFIDKEECNECFELVENNFPLFPSE